MQRTGILLCIIVCTLTAFAQDTTQLFLKSRVKKEEILLRWAPASPEAWQHTNHSGFILERYTVVRDSQLLEVPEKMVLGGEIIRAQPLHHWEGLIEKDDYAAVVAQALYGERFQLSGKENEGVARIIQLSQELEQRFVFSLFAADNSFDAACMAGWGWRDTLVKPGERYLYRVKSANPEDSSRITVGIGYATLDEYVELPVPGGVNAIWGDQRVTIAWEYSALLSVYNAYYIEKSTDGVNFRKLSEIPIVTGDDDVGSRSKRMMFIDSLPDNSSYWYYRIRGVNAFGETGPPSDSIFGRGRQAVPYVPSITHVSIDEYGELELFWNFEASANSWIEGFELQCSERIGGDYRVVKKNISPDRRSLRYAGLGASNYLIVTAVTKDDGVKKSFPVLVQPLDTIPPLPPVGLKGEVDTSGRVRLCWSPGMEHDLLGYRVFRANLRDEEPVYLFDSYITDSCYIDSVPIRNLNPDLYYYVIALDLRYNQSDYSEPLHLKKPDVIPPVSPVISGYFVNDHGIRIEWVNSPDADVKEHLLYRKKRGDKDSLLLKTFPERDATTYVDSDIRGGVYYSYSIFARDSSNLLSAPTPSLTACIVKDPIPDKKIKRFDAVVDRQNILIKLYWTDELPHVESYELYRSLGDEPMCLWRILPAWKKEITDEEPGEELKCHYIIRAVFRDGRNSESRELRID